MDTVGKRKRSEIMAKVRARGNVSTELKALKILRQNAITGWRRGARLFGRPDFVFRKSKVALFIDGCFWHGCPLCYRAPKSSQDYWSAKVSRNKQRDLIVSRRLKSQSLAIYLDKSHCFYLFTLTFQPRYLIQKLSPRFIILNQRTAHQKTQEGNRLVF